MSPRHGSHVRGLSNVPRSSIRDQRFGRLFRDLPPANFGDNEQEIAERLIALGRSISQPPEDPGPEGALDKRIGADDDDENPDLPAGYTYLGQFIDHDITFDPASSLDRFNDPEALQDFRTPRLDLDSVYGSGPDDQPFLYADDGAHLLLGTPTDGGVDGVDLPRNREFRGSGEVQRHALIGDKRNDENIIVSQLHTIFLRFHNRVLDSIAKSQQAPTADEFKRAQQTVRWHYQWIVLHDFLKRIVGEKTYVEVIAPTNPDDPGAPTLPNLTLYRPAGRYAFIPVEFSVAAYRYGHSQVRPSYALNTIVGGRLDPSPHPINNKGDEAKFFRVPIFSDADSNKVPDAAPDFKKKLDRANLNGFRQLPKAWAIDWGFFLDDVAAIEPLVLEPAQRSYKIDTQLVDPLQNLPDQSGDRGSPHRSLAIRNLLRGWRFELPSGQAVAHYLGIEPITDDVLFSHENATVAAARQKLKPHFKGNAPLWFYILKEAELEGGKHLGPVGGKIVAEVLAGLILADGQSFLAQWPTWTPTLPAKTPNAFTLADLVNFAIGRPATPAPVPPPVPTPGK